MLASVLTSLPWLAAIGLPLLLALTGSLYGAVIVGLLSGGVIAVRASSAAGGRAHGRIATDLGLVLVSLILLPIGGLYAAVVSLAFLVVDVVMPQAPAVPRPVRGTLTETRLAIATGLIGIATFAVLRLAPLYGTASSTISSTGEVTTSTGTATLPEVGFPIAIQILILGIPALVVFGAVVDARFPRRGRPIVGVAIALCAGLAILGAASIGLLLLPTLVLSVLVFRASRPRPAIEPRGSLSE